MAIVIVYSSRLKKDDELVPRSVRTVLHAICGGRVSVHEELLKVGEDEPCSIQHLIQVDPEEHDSHEFRRAAVYELKRLFGNGNPDAESVQVEFGSIQF